MANRILELALEALERQKAEIEAEMAGIRKGLSGARTEPAPPPAKRRRTRTAAQRKAQSEKMKANWAKRKAEAAKGKPGRKKRVPF